MSAEILGVKDIAFINNTLVFSLMHLFLTETDLDSVVTEINISKKSSGMNAFCRQLEFHKVNGWHSKETFVTLQFEWSHHNVDCTEQRRK